LFSDLEIEVLHAYAKKRHRPAHPAWRCRASGRPPRRMPRSCPRSAPGTPTDVARLCADVNAVRRLLSQRVGFALKYLRAKGRTSRCSGGRLGTVCLSRGASASVPAPRQRSGVRADARGEVRRCRWIGSEPC
jgi:hypothetical protein